MHIFLKVLTYSLIPLIVSGVISALSRAKSVKSKKDGTVYLSKALLIIGVIGATASIIPAIITLYSNEKIIVPIGFLAFAILSSTLIVAYINCRIYYSFRYIQCQHSARLKIYICNFFSRYYKKYYH